MADFYAVCVRILKRYFRTRVIKMAAVKGCFRKPIDRFSSEEVVGFLFSNVQVQTHSRRIFRRSLTTRRRLLLANKKVVFLATILRSSMILCKK